MKESVIALAIKMGSICKAWRAEAHLYFYNDPLRFSHKSTIMHPRHCFTLVRFLTYLYNTAKSPLPISA